MGPILLFLFLIGFCLPGALAFRSLDPQPTGFVVRISGGFVISMAVFAMVAWPSLWLGIQAENFWWFAGIVWCGFLAVTVATRICVADPTAKSTSDSIPSSGTDEASELKVKRPRLWLTMVVLGYLIWGGFVANGMVGKLNPGFRFPVAETSALIAWLVVGLLIATELGRAQRMVMIASGSESVPRLWTLTACLVIVGLMAGSFWMGRPDWDDADYLATVLRHADGGTLNREAASLPGEGLPVAPHMRLLAWELWGGTLCRWSGVDPMLSHHTFLPPFLILLVASMYWRLLGAYLLSPRLAPLAMIGLAGFWLFGNTSYESAGNYLLTRTWQGKTMLWHLGLPFEVLMVWDYLKAPSRRSWLGCLLATIGALSMSTSAVFLIIALVPTLCLAMIFWGAPQPPWQAYIGVVAFLSPLGFYGATIRSVFASYPVLSRRPDGASWQQSLFAMATEYGEVEIIWVLTLPILAALVASRSARAYLLGLPLVLLLSVLNPLNYEWVASHFTSYWTFYRLFWLFPIGLGLACAIALVSDNLPEVDRLRQRGGLNRTISLMIALGLVVGLAILPDRFVWSSDNLGPFPGLEPSKAANLAKIPGELLPIVRKVADDANHSVGRLLVGEHLSAFFTPFSTRIHLVSARPSYTVEAFDAAGRHQEGQERASLAISFLGIMGTASGSLEPQRIAAFMETDQAASLIDRYRVRNVVTDQCPNYLAEQLVALGFRAIMKSGPYQLWAREGVRSEIRP